jgi:hypothetical protein
MRLQTGKLEWVWWHMPVIPALWRQRQEDHETSLDKVSSETLSQKNKNKNKMSETELKL